MTGGGGWLGGAVTTFDVERDVVIGDAGDGQLLIMLVGGSLECGMVAESC